MLITFRSHTARLGVFALAALLMLSLMALPPHAALAADVSYVDITPIEVPGILTMGAASTYPATIGVSNISGRITSVTVTLYNVSHTNPSDLDIVLQAPNNIAVTLMSDVCGSVDMVNYTFVISDHPANPVMPLSSACTGSHYKTTNQTPAVDSLPSPAPSGTIFNSLYAFYGINPNGIWKLFVYDDSTSNVGVIQGGWRLSITTTDDPVTPPGNRITNGGFASGLSGWTFHPTAVPTIVNGTLALSKNADNPDWHFQQDVATGAAPLEPFELRLEMANFGALPKTLTMHVADGDYELVFSCPFTVLPGTPYQTYIMRFWSSRGLYPLKVWGMLQGDTSAGLRIDNIDLRHVGGLIWPGDTICRTQPPADTNLIYDSGFDYGLTSWQPWNSTATMAQIAPHGSVLEIQRNPGTPDGGFYQFSPYMAPASAVFQVDLRVGNRSASPRVVHMLTRRTDWSELRSCWLTLPANMPLTAYRMRFRTNSAWANIIFQVWLQDTTGIPALQFDQIELRYHPIAIFNQNVECGFPPNPQAPAPALIAPLELPVNTIAVAPIDPAQMGEGGIMAAPPVEAPVAAPVEAAKPGE